MGVLNNKKILLFAPTAFGYQNNIKKALECEGAVVHLYDERNNPSSIEKILIRKAHFLMKNKIFHYYAEVVNKEKDFSPDFIFFVNPEAITKEAINLLKRSYPTGKVILYMWDSLKNKHVKNILNCFDDKFSFDQHDAQKYGMKFRPLFYTSEFKESKNEVNYKYDISFVGTVHSDRAKILYLLKKYCDKNDLSYFFYLYIPGKLLYTMRMILDLYLRKWDKNFIHIEPISKSKISTISSLSRCVIDINHPKQTGLTMRTIEMIGLKKKLITTNVNIKKYDFYRPENQFVIDRKKMKFDLQKIYEKYQELPPEVYYKYSIEAWIRDVFSAFV
jgi:hypothetical protein